MSSSRRSRRKAWSSRRWPSGVLLGRLRKIGAALLNLPMLVRTFSRLSDATSAQDWPRIVDLIEPLHEKGFDSDDSRYRLACAYAMLGRWNEAIPEFESIWSQLPKPKDEARRLFNYALALTLKDRRDEAAGVLESCAGFEWPPHLGGKVQQLADHLRDNNVPPPSIQ